MQPAKAKLKKFRKVTKYPHHRSEGLTHRRNKGSQFQGRPNAQPTPANTERET